MAERPGDLRGRSPSAAARTCDAAGRRRRGDLSNTDAAVGQALVQRSVRVICQVPMRRSVRAIRQAPVQPVSPGDLCGAGVVVIALSG
ncbi:hypothetical protein ACFV23_05900 [Streptomyces sp. NPDC059627]